MVDFGFLSVSRKEKLILEGLTRHMEAVTGTVNAFSNAVDAIARGDIESSRNYLGDVFRGETTADTIHREFSLKIAEGAFFGGVREDILNLFEMVDGIADSAKDAARFLSSDSRLWEDARAFLGSDEMKHFLSDLKGAVSSLAVLIQALDKGRNEVLSKVSTVEDYEEYADTRKDALLGRLFERSNPMDPVTLIQLRDFLFVADSVADNAEDASDVILVMIAKGYG